MAHGNAPVVQGLLQKGESLSRRAATTTLAPLASLSWEPAPEAAYYSIYRTTTANGTFVKTNDRVLGTPFSMLEARGAKPVFYRVTATNAAGESAPSATR